MRGIGRFGGKGSLARGPAPLTLVSLGRWAGFAAAAGDLSRGCRVFRPGPVSGGEPAHHLPRALPVDRQADQLVVRVAHLPPAALRLLHDLVRRLRGCGRGVLRVVRHRGLRSS